MALSLFRQEVFEARATRLHGNVLLSSSLETWVTTVFLGLAITGSLSWAALTSYARTESVVGVVSSIQPLTKVFALKVGIATNVLVSEGDLVEVGARLVTVRIEQQAEAGGSTATAGLEAIDAQRKLAQQRLALEPARIASERTRLNASTAGARAQYNELVAQLAFQDDLVTSTRASFEKLNQVVADGFVTRTEYESRRQIWLQAEQMRRSLIQQREAAAANITITTSELARLPVDSAASISQMQTAVEQLAQGRAQQLAEQGYSITAPIAGRVTTLQIASGRFLDGRASLMTIVPVDAVMRVDLFAPSRSIGFVKEGQSVRLLYDAFPYQRFGSFGGTIESIDRAVVAPNELDAVMKVEEPVYRIRVKLYKQYVEANGAIAPLQPGMTLIGNIVLERRSFLDWVLAPIRAVRSRS